MGAHRAARRCGARAWRLRCRGARPRPARHGRAGGTAARARRRHENAGAHPERARCRRAAHCWPGRGRRRLPVQAIRRGRAARALARARAARARRRAERARTWPPAPGSRVASRDARRPAGRVAAARIHAAAQAARSARAGAHARAARGVALWMGRQRREQRPRRARAQPAQEALPGRDPHGARRRLRRRPAGLKPRSTRAVLLGGSIAVLLVVLGAAAWIGYDASEDEATELFDARLATSARVLAALAAARPADAGAAPLVVTLPALLESAVHDEAGPLGHHYETKIAFQVIDAQGRVLMRSGSAREQPYAPLAPGFSTQRDWRVFTLRSGDFWVQAAERDDVRGELSGKLALAAVAPLIAGIPLLLVLIALLLRYGLAPLAELVRRIERRAPDSLEPVELARTTAEIAPLVDALNGLLERVRAALARERRFTADAAHELRTPLAALKLHAQNAARAASAEERAASLARMLGGLERSIRLVEQMLALSRAAAAPGASAGEVALRQVVEDALDDALAVLKERSIR